MSATSSSKIDNETLELLQDFVQEAMEALEDVEPLLVALDVTTGAQPDDETLNRIFRMFHSLKGGASFLDLHQLERVTHEAESLLDVFRSGRATLSPGHVDLLLTAADFVRSTLTMIEGSGTDRAAAPAANKLVLELCGATQGTSGAAPEPVDVHDLMTADRDGDDLADLEAFLDGGGGGAPVDLTELPGTVEAEPAQPIAQLTLDPGIFSAIEALTEEVAQEAAEEEAAAAEASSTPEAASATASDEGARVMKQAETIRVDVDKLDSLMDLVGELIIAETMVVNSTDLEGLELPAFQQSAMHLNRITRELQNIAMQVRMVPIGTTFRKLPRLVRDAAQKATKSVVLVMDGESTEVDKTVAEYIADPLLHMIRNAVDHGIESAEVRRTAGKSGSGTVRLSACHEGGEVRIEVSDDGGGIDRRRVLKRAIERGLVESDRAAEMRDGEVFALLFEPGFSTAEQVTELSGRGVGMDVVKRNIEAMRGRVEITSELGVGTTCTMRIPLTLAIIEGMLVRVGDTTYTLPMLSIIESFRPETADVTVLSTGQEVVRLRDSMLEVVRMARLHDVPGGAEDLHDGILVVVEAGGDRCGLFVDEVLGQRQTVIKSLDGYLGALPGISGCSILGNGDISLIADVGMLMALARQGH